jgi:hypothetical protein
MPAGSPLSPGRGYESKLNDLAMKHNEHQILDLSEPIISIWTEKSKNVLYEQSMHEDIKAVRTIVQDCIDLII